MKINRLPLDENSNSYRRVRKALFGDPKGRIKTFAIVSTYNPLGLKGTTDEEAAERYKTWKTGIMGKQAYNNETQKELRHSIAKTRHDEHPTAKYDKDFFTATIYKSGKSAISMGNFPYAIIYGKYDGEDEKSFMLFNLPYIDAESVARHYGQESFFFGTVKEDKSIISYYVTSDYGKTYRKVDTSSTITYEDEATDYFSKYGFKFRINMGVFGDDIPEVIDETEFKESFDEDESFMGRSLHRAFSYRPHGYFLAKNNK